MQSKRLRTSDRASRPAAAKPGRWSSLALLAGVAIFTVIGCRQGSAAPIVTIHAASGDAEVTVELALTPAAQSRGLMYRTELAEDTGMLFVFDREAPRAFWMSNTPISLDILYIREDTSIVSIAAGTTPYSEKTIPSRGPARYVLEVPSGWAARHGVQPGDRLTLPPLPPGP